MDLAIVLIGDAVVEHGAFTGVVVVGVRVVGMIIDLLVLLVLVGLCVTNGVMVVGHGEVDLVAVHVEVISAH